jgi:hypothetical protein
MRSYFVFALQRIVSYPGIKLKISHITYNHKPRFKNPLSIVLIILFYFCTDLF